MRVRIDDRTPEEYKRDQQRAMWGCVLPAILIAVVVAIIVLVLIAVVGHAVYG